VVSNEELNCNRDSDYFDSGWRRDEIIAIGNSSGSDGRELGY
jgi:hypothetical protein